MSEDSRHVNETREIADRVADTAVKKVFAILGVNVDNPESVEEFRADLRFGKKLRKLADHSVLAAAGAVATGMLVLFVAGLLQAIKERM